MMGVAAGTLHRLNKLGLNGAKSKLMKAAAKPKLSGRVLNGA
jgi:hypothetical protein